MPRNPHPAASTLRNRNRITNKTRLKIHQGPLDIDSSACGDEDEEKNRLTNLVAGVDAEDANEHHLQEVLSAAHRNHVSNTKQTRGAVEKASALAHPTIIPTPDSTGIVDNYGELYPPNKWKDPASYVFTSYTVEDHITNGIANGFTYYMDERDQEWLDKNNADARGEGTSAQGAISVTGTRTSARSAKAKGKDPEAPQLVSISEDEFELVMGVFEKVTHDLTEFLHHSLETGMDFPAFGEYFDVFSAPLPPSMFSTYCVPDWIPVPSELLKMAKAIYPYWKERRIDRSGHRIIPALNFDESDTTNESYICFRRRETKAIRKTRASQATSSDKLVRLQAELSYPLEVAKSILEREQWKKNSTMQLQEVWQKRLALVDLKRKFSTAFNDKADEELLLDKEKPLKRSEILRPMGIKLRPNDPSAPPRKEDIAIRPKQLLEAIQSKVDMYLAPKEDDHLYEDQTDNPYQPPLVPYASKLFKYIPPPNTPLSPSSNSNKTDDESPTQISSAARAVRLRYGRMGRPFLDRRDGQPRRLPKKFPRSSLFALEEQDDEMDVDEDPEENERRQRLEERWRYDENDAPPYGPGGPEEQDRVLVDDYDLRYLKVTMTTFTDRDHYSLANDPSLHLVEPDGSVVEYTPFRLGYRWTEPLPQLPLYNYNPFFTPLQTRISNGGMHPPLIPISNLQTNGVSSNHASPPPLSLPIPQHSPSNGISRAAISLPHVDVKPEPIVTPVIPNGIPIIPRHETNGDLIVPMRPKSQTVTPQSHLGIGLSPNGYHLNSMANMSNTALINSAAAFQQNQLQQQPQATGLSLQQVQTLKSVFADKPNSTDTTAVQARTMQGYMLGANAANMGMQLPTNMNMNMMNVPMSMKLQASRQMWMNSPMQRPASVVNGVDAQLNMSSPNITHGVPVRSPSANNLLHNGVHLNGHGMSPPHMQLSPSPLPNIAQSQSPPRIPMTPNMGVVPLQQQSTGGGIPSNY